MAASPRRIEDYAVIGDGETLALVSRQGSVDWLCWPRFDSAACFAALLGTDAHGRWSLAPVGDARVTRQYRHDTLILETTFSTDEGEVTLTDFMPPRGTASELVRIVKGVRGRMKLRMDLAAARLLESDASLAEIAREVGYDSEFAFNRAFKRHRGLPPGVFRRSAANDRGRVLALAA